MVETYEICESDSDQIKFYDPGIGTGGWKYSEGKNPGEDSIEALKDQATGNGLQNNVNDAYRILMEVYEPGDQVFLFGFSRGAFTVRSLAGMLYKVGLLQRNNENLVEYAAKLYNIEGNVENARGFRETFSRPCPVHFIGAWDTVASLAMNAGKKWHDGSLNPEVTHGYHALAIDELRGDFEPALWREDNLLPQQNVEQVWFAGVHANVGGWYAERGLSNCALNWMLDAAEAKGLKISRAELEKRPPVHSDKIHNSRKGIWRARGKHVRSIPPGSKVHQSAIARRSDPDVRYSPKNLGPDSDYQIV